MSKSLIGWIAAGVGLVAAVGGLYWYLKRREAKAEGKKPSTRPKPGPTPSKPPRVPKDEDEFEGEVIDKGYVTGFNFIDSDSLPPEDVMVLNELFADGWPPDEETIDSLETDDIIVFAVESMPVGPYTKVTRESLGATVLVVEKTTVRARVIGEVRHSEHLGTQAGHGMRVGTVIDVPRESILAAAKKSDAEGYGSKGEPVATFKPSSDTKKTYIIYPKTPYDLRLPYRTPELEWHVDPKLATMEHVGDDGLLEQIAFTEGSLRGSVTVRAIDNDPELGKVLIGRWDFKLVD